MQHVCLKFAPDGTQQIPQFAARLSLGRDTGGSDVAVFCDQALIHFSQSEQVIIRKLIISCGFNAILSSTCVSIHLAFVNKSMVMH